MKTNKRLLFFTIILALIAIGLFLGDSHSGNYTSILLTIILATFASIYLYSYKDKFRFNIIVWIMMIIVAFLTQFAFLNNLHITASTLFLFMIYILSRFLFAFLLTLTAAVFIRDLNDFNYILVKPTKYTWLIILLVLGISLFYWVAFFPAAMTPDSLSQWRQAHTGEFDDGHPIIFTWLIMLLVKIWNSPGIIALFQILVVTSVYGYAFDFLLKRKVHPLFLGILTAIILVIPSFTIFSIIIWKDIIYSSFLLFFTVNLAKLHFSKGNWIKSRSGFLLLLLSAFGTAFFRHNGLPVFILTFVLLIILFRNKWKPLLSIFLIVFILERIIAGPVFHALNVKPSDPNEALSIPTQQIANIIVNDGDMTKDERAYFDKVFPIELWKEKYNPYNTNPIKFTWESYNREFIFKDTGLYFKNYISIVLKNPLLATEAFLKQSSLVWQVTTFKDGYTDTYVTNVYYGNDLGLKNEIISQKITNTSNKYLAIFKQPVFSFLWKPAFYHCIILLSGLFLAIRKGKKSLVIIVPWLLNTLSILAGLPAQDFRYLLASVFISIFLIAVPFIKPDEEEHSL